MADTIMQPPRSIEAPRPTVARPARGSQRRRLAVDAVYPTDAAAIVRLKRGDQVPSEACGWVQALAPGAIDVGELDSFIVTSLEKNGVFLPVDEDADAAAPLAVLKKSGALVAIDTTAGGE